jgi:biopolymer transport protein ExbB/TolQ
VAIPSGIGYNILVEQVRRLNLDMENFSQDFMLTVERSYKERR